MDETLKDEAYKGKSVKDVDQRVPFRKLFSFAGRLDVILMIVGTLAAITNGLTQPAMTILFGDLFNTFGTTPSNHIVKEVSNTIAKVLFVAMVAGAASFLQVTCWMVTGERQAARIRGLYLQTILGQDIAFFDTEMSTGEVISRMSGDTIRIQEAMGEKVGKFFQLASNFVGGFIVAFTKGWLLTLVLVACFPLIVLSGAIMSTIVSKMSSREQVAYAEAGVIVEQTVGAIRTVASFTGEKKAVEKYETKLRNAYDSTVRQGLATGLGQGTVQLVIFSVYALAIWYGVKFVTEKGYNGGQVTTIIFSVLVGGMCLGQTSPCMSAFALGQAAAYKMFKTIERIPQINPYSTRGIVKDDIVGDIELLDVYFRYPARPDVQIFSGFSLHVPCATTAALVGQSGSGKSTVISLLQRFYDPDSGAVFIDGIDIKRFQLKWLRQKLGLVGQEPVLFATTIGENIAYGKPNATQEDIRRAIELANAAKFIDKLPEGLDTMVGEHGTHLSGGQKQRIAIARAILKNPRIVLLDEATSALDAESERIVQNALENVMMTRTTIMVAHRLATVRNAELIAVVNEGRVVEQGTHGELIRDSEGAYSQLIRLQEGKSKGKTKDQEKPMSRSESRRSSSSRISSGRHSFSLNVGVPPFVGFNEIDIAHQEKLDEEDIDFKKKKRVSLSRLAYLNKPELPILLFGTAAAFIHGVLLPIFALILSSAIKTLYEPPDKMRKDSKKWAFLYMGLGLVAFLVVPIQHYLFGVAGGRLVQRIRAMTFDKVAHQQISWFDDAENSSGAVGARLSTDASNVRSLVGDSLALYVQVTATVIAGLVIALTANWMLTLLVIVVAPILAFQGYLQGRSIKGFSKDAKEMYEEASQVANDAVSGIRTVASFCAEKKVMDLYGKKCEGPMRKGIRVGLVSGSGFGFAMFALFITYGYCFYMGSVLIHGGKAEFGEVIRVFFALTYSSLAVSQTSAFASDRRKATESATSIFEILDSRPQIDSSSNEGITLPSIYGEINFENVSFKYPTRPDIQIFKDLCLSIPARKTIALVGESGSGKSTVICLLQRFYDPDSGIVFIDGMDIRKFKISWLRQQMGLVSQEPILFNESIRANIAYGKQGEPSEEEIIGATKAANAHNFIASLPKGYKTPVGERGVQLSGGQKQRIAIARAILKRPKILLLDEATSALDAESESVVQEALNEVMVNRTTVVVAHRLSTVKNADLIAVVKNGSIVEKGKHDALMKISGGPYASLVALHTTSL